MTCALTRLCAAVLFVMVMNAAQFASALNSDASELLAKYMTSDVVGVVYFNLDKLNLDVTIQNATKLGFQEEDELADLIEAMPVFKAEIGKLKQAGISRAYALLRSSDVQAKGTSWVLPLSPGSDSQLAKSAFVRIAPMLHSEIFAEIDATSDAVLASATALQMERLKNVRPAGVNPRKEMWNALGDGAFGILLFGDDDSRRVVSELMPSLPAPFELITGELVANDLDWGGVELKLDKQPNLRIEVQASNQDAATKVERILADSYGFLNQLPQTRKYIPESEIGFVFDALKPIRNGNRVSVSTERLSADMDRLAKVLAPQVKMVRVEATKTTKLNTLRQLALATHNFESAHSHFPTQATVDKNGKLLLSWRVQILPFVEQNELYKQFHLDEPWDSEHNLKLVQQMPECFKDPNPESRRNNKAGKTVYLGVAGEGMIFNGGKEIGFRDLTDGSSNTILIVAVAREHAEPWTKPTDWQVDLENPTAQLREVGRTEVEVAIADGSTNRIPISTELKTWQGLVQAADGEGVELPR